MYRSIWPMRFDTIGILLFISFCFIAILNPESEAYGQNLYFSDGFSDGDFDRNPAWNGADSLFTIIETSGNSLLQLDAGSDDDGDAYLSTPSGQKPGCLEFYLNMDFAPSGSNYTLIYVMSDRADLDGPVNGYAIRAGEPGTDDRLHLIRLDRGQEAGRLISGQLPIGEGGGYRIKINRSATGVWTLQEAKGYDGMPGPELGQLIDNIHSESTHLGIRTLFTSTRSDKFYFDFKISLNAIALRQLSESKLETVFSTALKRSSVDNEDFILTNIGSPQKVSFHSDSVLHLEFAHPIPDGDYILRIDNIEGRTDQEFDGPANLNLSIFSTSEPDGVVINEFMYKPPSGAAEYVELKNTGAARTNLKGWYLQDNRESRNIITNKEAVLEPGSFIVITGDTTALLNTFGNRRYVQMPDFPALNDAGGDAIRLYDSHYRKIDSLTYTPDWGGNRVALERQSTYMSAIHPENWASGFGTQIGTPGMPNNKQPGDTTAPTLSKLQINDSSTVRLIFSETLKTAGATDLNNFTIYPHLPIERLLHHRDTVDILLGQPMTNQTEYHVTVSPVEDLFGNVSPVIQRSATYYRYTQAAKREIVINEFLYKGEPEFVELYNRSGKVINLKGWTLADGNGYVRLSKRAMPNEPLQSIQSSIPILPDSYVVLTGNQELASDLNNTFYLKNFPSLNNGNESVSIHDELNTTIDSLYYDNRLWSTGQNQSLERKDPEAASTDPSNWSPSPKDFSPGMQNHVYEIDIQPPDIKFAHILQDSTIEVLLTEFIMEAPDSWKFNFADEQLSLYEFDKERADRLVLNPPGKFDTYRSSKLIIEGLSDISGNQSSKLSSPVAWPLEADGVIINEILSDPLSDDRDNLPDQAEYVELYNRNDYAVSLEGIYLHNEPNENGITRDLHPISTQAKWVPAHSHALVHASTNADILKAPVIRFFNMHQLADNRNIIINRMSLSLNQKQDAIYLADSTGTTIDSVFYRQNWHNPNLIDTKGLSMERISPDLPSNDPDNWSSSAHTLGGTPATHNSIFMKPDVTSEKSSISFSPNPFSPDGDGHEDHLAISYTLDAPDYLLRVRIFDRHGRLVRYLADAKQTGPEQKLIWDGRNNKGSDLRIGIYIVLFEAYNSSSGQDRTFKKTVVIARKL